MSVKVICPSPLIAWMVAMAATVIATLQTLPHCSGYRLEMQMRLQNLWFTGLKFIKSLLDVEESFGGVNACIHVAIRSSIVECQCAQ